METRNALLTDFDGTLTNVAGGGLVFTDHYHTVMATPELTQQSELNSEKLKSIHIEIADIQREYDRLDEEISDLKRSRTDDHDRTVKIKKLRTEMRNLEGQLEILQQQKLQFPTAFYHLAEQHNYSADDMIERSRAIAANMQQHPHEDFELATGAKEFLHHLLKAGAAIHIISKNHEEYIRAVLLHNGFSQAEIKQIQICDLRHGGGNKYSAAANILKAYGKNTTIAICDDDHQDYTRMKTAAENCELKELFPYQASPGNFDFKTIGESLLPSLKTKAALQFYAVLNRSGTFALITHDKSEESPAQSSSASPPSPKK